MPLRENEDKLLRWICGPGRAVVPPYKDRQGNWRPDYLLEKVVLPDGSPLHIVNENFDMKDPVWLAKVFREKTGQEVRFVKPSDLKWLPDEASNGAHRVFCSTEDGCGIERVYQVDFEIEQEKFEAIDFKNLCHLAPTCINDLRSVFFINDQRFLGIVYEELENLVLQGTLTGHEAEVLRQGLAPSFLPTSSTWAKVIEESEADPTVKDQWVLKNARSGLSKGHVFGRVTDKAKWLDKLMSAKVSNCNPDGDSYVLQRYIEQTEYDTWSHLTSNIMRSHLVSSYFSSNGQFLGIGGMRTSDLTILSMINGVGYLLNVVTAL
ncbi:hypothetical protein NKR19_g1310 [Coniochaeta hoffmannii]|uniref:Uncharacterized protein n=1 Tax=Coniochaeta hoffmannii TaxID=91930 RepID=A0AA38W059_9PEZI|nr:hypothetical protein NKR19_g1310 [Coniochaeta hoffmannii]